MVHICRLNKKLAALGSASSGIRGAATGWRRHERSRPAQCGDAVPDTAKPDSLWHRDCHKGKTASDRVRMAKVDRLRKAHLDLKKRKRRKLQSRSLPTRIYQTAHVPGA